MQRDNALPAGREFIDVVTTIVGGQRRHPLRCMFGKIFDGQEAAMLRPVGVNRFGDVAFIKGVPAACGNLFISTGKVRIFEYVAGLWRRAARHVDLPHAGILFAGLDVLLPQICNKLGDGETFLRVADRRRQQIGHRQSSVALVQFIPAIYCARHADGERPEVRDAFHPQVPEVL